MPNSFTPWTVPPQGIHPRVLIRKGITGTTGSTSSNGQVVTLGGSPDLSGVPTDGSWVVWVKTSGGTKDFGNIIAKDNNAKTVTVSASEALPTSQTLQLWALGIHDGKSVASCRARLMSTHSSWWSGLLSSLNNRLNTGEYPNSWYESQEAEMAYGFAYAWLMDPTGGSAFTNYATRARTIALHFVGLSYDGSFQGRQDARILAHIYDLLYDWPTFTSSDKSSVRGKINTHIENRFSVSNAEFNWGGSHGNAVCALEILQAVLEDGSATDNTRWRDRVDYLLDKHDLGESLATFLGGFRHFAEDDGSGGTAKGMGPGGYDTVQEDFHTRVFPALRAIEVDWEESEAWWDGILNWKLWTWRPDNTFFRQNETRCISRLRMSTQIHLHQAQPRRQGTMAEHLSWLEDQIIAVGQPVTGGYSLLPIVYQKLPRAPATRPSVATMGGKPWKFYEKAGVFIHRLGTWTVNDVVGVHDISPYFLGGHTHRRVGNIQFAAFGAPLLYDKAPYDVDQSVTYKTFSDATETGQRYTAKSRDDCGARMWLIKDVNEPSEAPLNFQRSAGASTKFGYESPAGTINILNRGGQRWPRGAGGKYQPDSMADVFAPGNEAWIRDIHEVLPASVGSPAKGVYYAASLKDAYHAAKCSKFLQHVLIVDAGQIPNWPYPIWIVYEDMATHTDPAGKLTQRLLLNARNAPTGSSGDLRFDNAGGRMWHMILRPNVEHVVVNDLSNGVVIDGIQFLETDRDTFDDPNGVRVEINPETAGANQAFLSVIFMAPTSVSAHPTTTLFEDSTDVGATIGGITCKMKKASPFSATIGDSGDTIAPPTPTNLDEDSFNQRIELDWDSNSNPDGDLKEYEVFESAEE